MKYFFKLVLLTLLVASCKSVKYPNLEDGLYADIQTNKGDILLKLYAEKVPMTVANFVALAEGNHPNVTDSLKGEPFYNGVRFHRVIKNFMIQSGDRLGTGAGNAGYKFADEFPIDSLGNLLFKHDGAGVLSMANSGKNTNSSQFFITHKDTPWLDGKHSVFGKVALGQAVVDSIVQNDTIHKIKIIRVGKFAKQFKASTVFTTELKNVTLKEEERLKKIEAIKSAFLKEKGFDESIKTNSGLQILTLKKGAGNKITNTSKNTLYYTLYTANGKKIESNVGAKPLEFSISDGQPLMAGFKEGVLTMQEGEKARLFVPYYIGLGAQANGVIPAKTDLVFEIEVTKVVN